MNDDDLRHTSDDAARTHSSDAVDDLSQLDIPALPDFGDLPGFADLPELAPLPELDALQEPAMPEIVMPDLEMPDLNQFLTVTPPAPADVPQPDAAPATGAAAAAGPTAAQTSSASHDAATASSQKRSRSKQESRPTVAVEPTPVRAAGAPAPAKKGPHLLLTSLIWIVLISVGFSIIAPGHRESSSKPGSQPSSSRSAAQANSEVREHAEGLPTRAPGYRGSATNTHSISAQWASGVATAWTLELPPEMTQFEPQMFVEGQVLYVAGYDTIEGQRGSAVRTQAYDLSGEEPTLLWDTIGPTENSAIATYTPAFVSGENQLFFHDVVIDKATGAQTQAPWGREFPIAQADGIVVTCSTPSTCSGWTQTAGVWTNRWETPTNPQLGYGFATQGLGYAPEGAILAGSGTRASTLVPTSSEQPLQILDIHTGLGTVLPPPGATEKTHNIEVTSDGFIVLDLSTKQGTVLDSRGTVQSSFTVDGYSLLPAVSSDGNQPSTADIKTFMTTKTANWATGTVDLVGEDDCSIEVTLSSDGSAHTTPVPGALSQYLTSSCYFEPKEVRVSADASVLYADTFTYQDKSRYFIDTVNGLMYTSPELNAPKQIMWVFDDMLIGITEDGIKAFVPASS
jgi:hypothetical protein